MSYTDPLQDDYGTPPPDPTAQVSDTPAPEDYGSAPASDSRPDPTAAVSDTTDFADAGGTGTDTGYNTPDPTAHKKTPDPTADVSDSSDQTSFADTGGTAPTPTPDPTAAVSDSAPAFADQGGTAPTPPPDPTAAVSDTYTPADTRQAGGTAPSGDIPFTPDQSLRYGNAAANVFAAQDAGSDPTAAISDANSVEQGIGREQAATAQQQFTSRPGVAAEMTDPQSSFAYGANAFPDATNQAIAADAQQFGQAYQTQQALADGVSSFTTPDGQSLVKVGDGDYSHWSIPGADNPANVLYNDNGNWTAISRDEAAARQQQGATPNQFSSVANADSIAAQAMQNTALPTSTSDKLWAAASIVGAPLVAAGLAPLFEAAGTVGGISVPALGAAYVLKGTGETVGSTLGGAPGGIADLLQNVPVLDKVTAAIASMPIPEVAQNPLAQIEQVAQTVGKSGDFSPLGIASAVFNNALANAPAKDPMSVTRGFFTEDPVRYAEQSGLQQAGIEYLLTSTVALSGASGLLPTITVSDPVGKFHDVFTTALAADPANPMAAAAVAFDKTNNAVAEFLHVHDLLNPLFFAIETPGLEGLVSDFFGNAGAAARVIPGAAPVMDFFTQLSSKSGAEIAARGYGDLLATQVGGVGNASNALSDLYAVGLAFREQGAQVARQMARDYLTEFGGGITTDGILSQGARLVGGAEARMVAEQAADGQVRDLGAYVRSIMDDYASQNYTNDALQAAQRGLGFYRPGDELSITDTAALNSAARDLRAATYKQMGLDLTGIENPNLVQKGIAFAADTLRTLFLLPGAPALAFKKILDEAVRSATQETYLLRPADMTLFRSAANFLEGRDSSLLQGVGRRIEDASTVRGYQARGLNVGQELLRTPVSDRAAYSPFRMTDKILDSLVSSPTQHVRLNAAYQELAKWDATKPEMARNFADNVVAAFGQVPIDRQAVFADAYANAVRANSPQDFARLANGYEVQGAQFRTSPNVPASGFPQGRPYAPSAQVRRDIFNTGGPNQFVKDVTSTRPSPTWEEIQARMAGNRGTLPNPYAPGDIAAGDGYLSSQFRANRDDLNAMGGFGNGRTRDYKPGSAAGSGGRRAGVSDDLIAGWKSGAVNPDEIAATARQYLEQARQAGNVPMQHAIEDMLLDNGQAAVVAGNRDAYAQLNATRQELFGPSTTSEATRAIRRGNELAAAPAEAPRAMTPQERIQAAGLRPIDGQGIRVPSSDARFAPFAPDDADTAAFVQSRGGGIPEERGPLTDVFGPNHSETYQRATGDQAATNMEQRQFRQAAGQQESPFTRSGEIPRSADPTAMVSDTYLLPEGERSVSRPGMADLAAPPSLPGQYPDNMFLANNGGVMLSPEAAQSRALAEQSRLSNAQYRRGQFDPAALGSTPTGGANNFADRYRPTYSGNAGRASEVPFYMPQPVAGDALTAAYNRAGQVARVEGGTFGQAQMGAAQSGIERGNRIIGNFREQTRAGELLSHGSVNGQQVFAPLLPFASFHVHTTQFWASYFLEHPAVPFAIARTLGSLPLDEYGGMQTPNGYLSGALELSTAAKLVEWARGLYGYSLDAIRNPNGNNPLQTAAKIAGYATVGNGSFVNPFEPFKSVAQGALASATNPLLTAKGKTDPRELMKEQGAPTLTGSIGQYANRAAQDLTGHSLPRNAVNTIGNPGQAFTNLAANQAINAVDALGGHANRVGYEASKGIPYMADTFGTSQGWEPARTQSAVNDAAKGNPVTPDGKALLDAYQRQQDRAGLMKASPVTLAQEGGKPVYPQTPFDKNAPVSYSPGGSPGKPDFYVNKAEFPDSTGFNIAQNREAVAQSKSSDPGIKAAGETFLNANPDRAFTYARNAGTGGRDLGVGQPPGSYTDAAGVPNGYYVQPMEQAQYNTARADIAKSNPVTNAGVPFMDYNRQFLQNPDIAAFGSAKQQASLSGEIAGNVARTGAGLPQDQRLAKIASTETLQQPVGTNPDGTPFTLGDLLNQSKLGDLEGQAKALPKGDAKTALENQIAGIKAELSRTSPVAAAYLAQQDAAFKANSPGNQWYAGQPQPVKDAYDAFNDLRNSADYQRLSELEKAQTASGAFGSPGEKAWYAANGAELNRLKGVVGGAEQEIINRNGVNPKQVANEEAIAAGRAAPYQSTDVTKPASSGTGSSASKTSGSTRTSPRATFTPYTAAEKRAYAIQQGGGKSYAGGASTASSGSVTASNTFFNEYKALAKGTPEYKAAVNDPVVRDILGAKGATAAQYETALTALRNDVQKARTPADAIAAGPGTTPASRDAYYTAMARAAADKAGENLYGTKADSLAHAQQVFQALTHGYSGPSGTTSGYTPKATASAPTTSYLNSKGATPPATSGYAQYTAADKKAYAISKRKAA